MKIKIIYEYFNKKSRGVMVTSRYVMIFLVENVYFLGILDNFGGEGEIRE